MSLAWLATTLKAVAITLAMLWLNQPAASGQSDSVKSEVKLSNTEQIWMAAYDDTTKALASLFIAKRNEILPKRRNHIIGLGVSAAALGLGTYMLEHNSNSSTPGVDEGPNYAGLLLALVGVSGVLTTGVGFGGYSILLNRYTMKKYYGLIEMYKSGKPLPEFYARKITPFLRRNI